MITDYRDQKDINPNDPIINDNNFQFNNKFTFQLKSSHSIYFHFTIQKITWRHGKGDIIYLIIRYVLSLIFFYNSENLSVSLITSPATSLEDQCELMLQKCKYENI